MNSQMCGIRGDAWRTYNFRLVWLSLLYAILLITAVYSFKHSLVSGLLAYVLAILPALPIIGIFVAIGRYLMDERDEYVRMLMVRQTLWASGFVLSVATIVGFLQNFDLIGRIDVYWIVVAWYFGLGIGAIVNKLTLGDGGR